MRLTILLTVFFFLGINANAQMNAETFKTFNCDSINKVTGIASFYHSKFVGRKTATGDIFSNNLYTAASNKLPLGTYVKVINLSNGKEIYVLINDRMAKSNKRLIDLTNLAASKLHFRKKGITRVKLEPVTELEGRAHVLAQQTLLTTPNNKL